MKQYAFRTADLSLWAFSILERIDVGETACIAGAYIGRGRLSVSSNGSTWVKLAVCRVMDTRKATFSILERIDVGETRWRRGRPKRKHSFSILERIDVGETPHGVDGNARGLAFQYPRTDRRG